MLVDSALIKLELMGDNIRVFGELAVSISRVDKNRL
jgi:hypothetical protein